jgi:hypothetical protein
MIKQSRILFQLNKKARQYYFIYNFPRNLFQTYISFNIIYFYMFLINAEFPQRINNSLFRERYKIAKIDLKLL